MSTLLHYGSVYCKRGLWIASYGLERKSVLVGSFIDRADAEIAAACAAKSAESELVAIAACQLPRGVVGIPLTSGGFSLVDAEDIQILSTGRWCPGKNGYVYGTIDGMHVLLHRHIMGLKGSDGLTVDHKNRNKLDNKKCNLRVASMAENAQNKGATSSSGFRGVYRSNNPRRPWHAVCKLNGKVSFSRTFIAVEDAAKAASEWRRLNMPYSVED